MGVMLLRNAMGTKDCAVYRTSPVATTALASPTRCRWMSAPGIARAAAPGASTATWRAVGGGECQRQQGYLLGYYPYRENKHPETGHDEL